MLLLLPTCVLLELLKQGALSKAILLLHDLLNALLLLAVVSTVKPTNHVASLLAIGLIARLVERFLVPLQAENLL